MPAFQYTTRDAAGGAQSGTLVAGSIEALTAELRARGLLVVDVQPVPQRAGGAVTWNPRTWLPATGYDAELGFQQLATMLGSGLSLLAALRIVAEHARRPRAQWVWRDVARRIEEGTTFSTALSAHPRVFSPHVVQLARVGEHAGALEASLTRAADHLERVRALRLLVLNALAYPLLVAVMAAGVAAFMVVGVIPKIQKFLGGSTRRLPAITQLLLDISNAVTAGLPYICVGIVALVIALALCRRWPPGRLVMDAALLRMPVVGRILRLSGTAVFARSLGSLLDSGVTLLDGLSTVEHLVPNRVLSVRVATAREVVLRGGTLSGALSGGRDFLPMLARMVAVGESAGTLGPVLGEVAKFHEGQLVIAIRRMSAVVEPVLILVVGGIVGFVYIAFFISLFSLAGGLR